MTSRNTTSLSRYENIHQHLVRMTMTISGLRHRYSVNQIDKTTSTRPNNLVVTL